MVGYEVVIVGGGLGGLECGYILSRLGMRVLVLEQGARIGGCLQSYRRQQLSYDTGFHYVGGLDEGQSLHAAFHYLGLLDLPWHRLDPQGFDCVTIGRRHFAYAEGYDAFARQLGEDFPSERDALRRYADLLRRISMQQFAPLNPQCREETLASLQQMMATGAWKYLNEKFKDPLLINVLSGTALKMELRKQSLPLFTFLHGHGGYVESSWRLKGDGAQIAEALAAGIRAQGGDIVCKAKVEQLMVTDGKVTTAVCANGERYEGRVFVCDVHPQQVCRMTAENRWMRPAYRRRIGALDNTFGMATVSLRIRPQSLRYFNCNHYVYRKDNVWDFYQDTERVGGVLVCCRVPEDDGEYVRQVDLLTPMMWSQCEPWTDSRVGRRGEHYAAMKRRVAEQCVALASEVLPELACQPIDHASTPLTWRDYTLTPQGTAYGIRKDYNNPLATMLSVRTPLQNLLLTGQNLMVHGIHGVTMTAFYTCAEVVGKEKIWEIIGNDNQ